MGVGYANPLFYIIYRLMNKKLKKYYLKYNYLQLEKEDIDEEFLEYKKDFDTLFAKYFIKDEPEEIWVNESTGETRKTPPPEEPEVEDEVVEPKEPSTEQVKKLYKKLSIKTHPDKGGNKEDFQKISRAYKTNNVFELIYFAGEYDIDIEITPVEERIVEENIHNMEHEINHIKSTLAWAWAVGDNNSKKQIIQQIQNMTGKQIEEDFGLD